jgi:tetratricopeptide (TPR) repeat protein
MKELIPKLEEGFDYNLRERESFYADFLHGEILLAENSPDDAIAILEKTSLLDHVVAVIMGIDGFILNSKLPVMKDVLARAYYQNGEIDKAIEEYETLTTFNPNRKGRDLIHPKYHYRLAKLYEEKGWPGKAIERYEKFLDFWKDADEDLPEPHDARARLARLRGDS